MKTLFFNTKKTIPFATQNTAKTLTTEFSGQANNELTPSNRDRLIN